MTRLAVMITFTSLMFSFASTKAQGSGNSFEPKANGKILVSAGVGASGWGIPVFARLEFPVSENITVGGGASYQTTSESFLNSRWRHSIIGVHGRGNYHFNTLLNIPSQWDLYAGASLGYYIWKTNYNGDFGSVDYNGSGAGGASLGMQVGGQYFFKDNIAVNLEFGGGTVLGGGTVGLTFML